MVARTGFRTEGRSSPSSFQLAIAASPRAWLVAARMI
jgi:hypothetical protein